MKEETSGIKRFKKSNEEEKYDKAIQVLEATVHFTCQDEKEIFPYSGRYILTELVFATVEYLTGIEGRHPYEKRICRHGLTRWQIYKYFSCVLESFGKELPSEIIDALKLLTKNRYGSNELEAWTETTIDRHWSCVYRRFSSSTSFLDENVKKRIKEKVLPSLSKEELKVCQVIGKLMRKYIDRDCEHIKKTYHW